ncbi:MAG: preprotein translocase subunit SecA [Candidatus Sungbacteria bacterium]|nr:preprotein translocase subunit SecA [Candidatus Sungbacteria bacterium]
MALLGKIFGDANARYIKTLQQMVEGINGKEQEFRAMSDEELRAMSGRFKQRLAAGETLDDILPDAFAAVREAAWRTIRKRHFDVQLIGGMALHQGKIAEMRTGEGKTLVATLPLYVNSLAGKGAHLVTPNDYLSKVGAGWMGPVYYSLGASVGVVTHDSSGVYDPDYTDPQQHADERLRHFRPVSRHEAYMADITYGTNNEFGFDYLRDNLEYSPQQLRQRGHYFAIVDEVDSILIDEARTPLIISMPDHESGELYGVFSKIIPQLKSEADYNVDEKLRAVAMTEEGIDKVEKILNIGNIYEERGVRFVHHLEQALRAEALYQRDRDYVVADGEVIIVDEFTGRLMPGRRWSEGLHQAVEAKEGVTVQQESRTLATITFQNYFRMYEKLSGMTGTAQTSAEEFHKVYNLDVVTVPTHRPMVRRDLPDLVFRTEKGKFQALAREVKALHEKGQPVLIGTVSIEKNERLSKMLSVEGVPHELLNAKNHEREALIIAQAGRKGAVTVATNLAGRGVDIILGGSAAAEALADKEQGGNDAADVNESEEVKAVGGLHVIGTERHEARRIDNQLRGRAGRQGDPGSSQFFVSFEDDLMRIFGSDKIKRMMEAFGIAEDEAIENKMVTRAIESAQAKIEGFHFDTRKHVLEFDDVLNKQRDAIYRMRRSILFSEREHKADPEVLDNIDETRLENEGEDMPIPQTLKSEILEMIREEISHVVEYHTTGGDEAEWDVKEVFEVVKSIVPIADSIHDELAQIVVRDQDEDEKRSAIIVVLVNAVEALYDEREQKVGVEGMANIERAVMLQSIDALWMDHLDQMEHLRDSVRLRAYGQRDPLVEYKNEGSRLFRDLQIAIRSQIVGTIFKVGEGAMIREEPVNLSRAQFSGGEEVPSGAALAISGSPRMPQAVPMPAVSAPSRQSAVQPKEPDRNAPCPCGSGKKYKKCGLVNSEEHKKLMTKK